MRKFHRFLLTLLCLAIPLQGMAGVRAIEQPCPMEQEMAQMDHDQQVAIAAEHDCCNDPETAAHTGKFCKTGIDCQISAQYATVSVTTALSLPALQAAHYPVPVFAAQSFDASSVWRPPTRS